jgi:hypothetical protein
VKLNIARLLYIGKVLLNYSEKEVWKMTLSKIITMYKEYKSDHGIIDKKVTIDDVIPL